MKIQAGRADAFVRKPDEGVHCILLYGPDAGLVRERGKALLTGALGDAVSDPFRFVEVSPAQVKDSAASLVDEANAMALTGGRRGILVRDAGDGLTSSFQALLEAKSGDSLVVCEAGDLGPRSSLRKLFEGVENAAAVPCYLDEGAALDRVIGETMKESGLALERDAKDWLISHLGGDRGLTRQELQKLVAFKGADKSAISLADVLSCIGDSADLGLDDLSLSIADGDRAMADRVYNRLTGEGTHPIQILTAVSRHFMRLHQARAHVDGGVGTDQALSSLRPPVFFKIKGRVAAQVGRWSSERLDRALSLLNQAEMQAKSTDMPVDALVNRALLQLCAAAARR